MYLTDGISFCLLPTHPARGKVLPLRLLYHVVHHEESNEETEEEGGEGHGNESSRNPEIESKMAHLLNIKNIPMRAGAHE